MHEIKSEAPSPPTRGTDSQHDASASVLTDEEITTLAFARAIEAELASRGRAQGGNTSDDERAYEAMRLRRVVRALGMDKEVPENDAALRDCLFSVLGMIAGKLERASQAATTASADVSAISMQPLCNGAATTASASGAAPKSWVAAGEHIVIHDFPGMITNCIAAATTEKRKEFIAALLAGIEYEIEAARRAPAPSREAAPQPDQHAAQLAAIDRQIASAERNATLAEAAQHILGDTVQIEGTTYARINAHHFAAGLLALRSQPTTPPESTP